ncbi:RNA-directed DNA polymerase, eukaryota, reverse transcriptase zinc-binding domain protein [Tanacetum coccineum]
MLLFKVDFEKAFDSVSWKYLDFILLSLGFGSKWRSWIRACLHSSRASILINGSPISEFSIKRGLRQGDHLSPFLFILVMEGLHCAMSNANSGDLDIIIRILHVFHLALGIRINIHKSNIYGIAVSDVDVSSMASRTGCAAGSFPFTYLDLPIGSNMNIASSWHTLVNRFQKKVDIDTKEDTCVWTLSEDDVFYFGSTRRLIYYILLPSMISSTNWEKFLPRKVNIFLWRMSLDWLPHWLNLSARGIDIPMISYSSFNGNVESADHIFFECDLVKEVWSLVRKWCDIPFPQFASFDVWKNWMWKKHGRMMLDSIDNGPLVYPTVEENRQTRPKKYSELTEAQQLQDD